MTTAFKSLYIFISFFVYAACNQNSNFSGERPESIASSNEDPTQKADGDSGANSQQNSHADQESEDFYKSPDTGEMTGEQGGGVNEIPGPAIDLVPTLQEISKKEQECEGASSLEPISTKITFEPTTEECNWNTKTDARVAAYRRQPKSILLEEGRTVCNIKLAFPSHNNTAEADRMQWDDVFILTLTPKGSGAQNTEIFLASQFDYTPYFRKVGEFYAYNFDSILGKGFDGGNKYCSSDAVCQLPVHDSSLGSKGDINLVYSAVKAKALTNLMINAGELEFAFIITGDDDISDCQHDKPFDIDVTVEYAN